MDIFDTSSIFKLYILWFAIADPYMLCLAKTAVFLFDHHIIPRSLKQWCIFWPTGGAPGGGDLSYPQKQGRNKPFGSQNVHAYSLIY